MNDVYLIRKLDQVTDIVEDCQNRLKDQRLNCISVSSGVVMSFTKEEIYVNGIRLFNYPSIEYEVMSVLLKHYLLDMINEAATQLNSLQIIHLFNRMYTEDSLYKTIYRIRKKIKSNIGIRLIEENKAGYFISRQVSIRHA